MSTASPLALLIEAFGALPDPRIDRCKKHRLLEILMVAPASYPSLALVDISAWVKWSPSGGHSHGNEVAEKAAKPVALAT